VRLKNGVQGKSFTEKYGKKKRRSRSFVVHFPFIARSKSPFKPLFIGYEGAFIL
jgi:hypothetical protein